MYKRHKKIPRCVIYSFHKNESHFVISMIDTNIYIQFMYIRMYVCTHMVYIWYIFYPLVCTFM